MRIKEENIAKDVLREVGLSATAPRICIYDILVKAKKPLSVEAVNKKTGDDIDQATVYRTLKSFEEVGLVSAVMLGHGHAHYFLTDKEHHAHYIVCRKCGYVENIHECAMQSLERKTIKESKHFNLIQGHIIEMFGVCKKCYNK